MKIKNIVLIIIIFTLFIGCSPKEKTDSQKFKDEYEKYNNISKLNINENNIIKYSSKEEINKIISQKTGVIFIGDPQNKLSRVAIKILLEASESTDLNQIYYLNSLDGIKGLTAISSPQIPLVLNVLKGEIKSYNVGTINNKTKLTEDEEMELFNKYTDGIHQVLEDACDERC